MKTILNANRRVSQAPMGIAAICLLAALHVVSAEELQIRDIAPPLDSPRSYLSLLLICGTVLLALFGGAFYCHRRRVGAETETSVRSSSELALQALEQLREQHILQLQGPKEFYQRATDILRHYLASRFEMRAPELTTGEFLAGLSEAANLHPHQKEFLRQLFSHCDLVKFAEHQPSADEVENVFAGCGTFIREAGHEV